MICSARTPSSQAEIEDSEADRNAAARRCLDHYLHTAHAGAVQSNRIRKPLDLAPPAPGAVPEEFSGRGQALAWFDAESPVMLELLAQAISSGNDEYVWQIAWTLSPFLYRRDRWHEGIGIQRQSLRAAQRLGDPVGLGHAHYELGRMLVNLGDFRRGPAAPGRGARRLRPARRPAPTRPPSIRDSARCSSSRAGTRRRWCTRGRRCASCEEIGPITALASIENSVGWLYAHLGQCDGGADVLPALAEVPARDRPSRRRGRHLGQPRATRTAGCDDHAQAAECYSQAVEIYHEIGDRFHEAGSHIGLGDAQLHAGDPASARKNWEQALAILESIPHQDAEQARARLNQLVSSHSVLPEDTQAGSSAAPAAGAPRA